MRGTIWVFLLATTTGVVIGQARPGEAQKSENNFSPVIPRTWDEEALALVELPLASTGVPPSIFQVITITGCPCDRFTKAIRFTPPAKSHADTLSGSNNSSLKSCSIRRSSRRKRTGSRPENWSSMRRQRMTPIRVPS